MELVLGDVALVSVWVCDESVRGEVELMELELLLGVVAIRDWSDVAELVLVFAFVLVELGLVAVPVVELV